MSRAERVVLAGDHTHLDVLEDGREHPRTFRAGQHALPPEVAASARQVGLVDEDATKRANAVRVPRARKPTARKAPAKKPAARKR
jgi:hypothetical protein